MEHTILKWLGKFMVLRNNTVISAHRTLVEAEAAINEDRRRGL
jgi:phosphoribosylcarboxyaminoimidazole (NCAIR) mutase